jgi:uncharacterized protein YkwD
VAAPFRRGQRRKPRALRPAVVATIAVVAVGVASTVGVLTLDDSTPRPAAAAGPGNAPAAGTGTPAAAPAVGIQSAPTTPPSGTATPPSGAPPTAAPPAATTPAAPNRTKAPPPPAKPTGDPNVETAVLTLVNQERAKGGCQPVTADSRLATAARLHSEDMAARNFFDHTNPDGVSFAKRINNAGYQWSGAGENIAKGQATPAAVMESWMNSPGHRANILNCGFKQLGVGVAYQGRSPIWTQDFASPMG